MAENVSNCPVCQNLALAHNWSDHVHVKCNRCGEFNLTDVSEKIVEGLTSGERAKISGWLREQVEPQPTISQDLLTRLRDMPMPSVGEKADKILMRLAKDCPTPGTRFGLNGEDELLELEAIAWTEGSDELQFLIKRYLIEEKGFLRLEGGLHIITPQGWSYLDSLRRGNPQSHIGFIAMWFNDEVKPAWTAMDQAIRFAGYSPLRIDQKQHNNKIDDEIVAGIRRSKFLVADFTGQRGGVYFETGLAMGLGLPVIWLCRHDHLKEVHFDTRQYNFIVWEADKLAELTKALQNRIEATIGKGPVVENPAPGP